MKGKGSQIVQESHMTHTMETIKNKQTEVQIYLRKHKLYRKKDVREGVICKKYSHQRYLKSL